MATDTQKTPVKIATIEVYRDSTGRYYSNLATLKEQPLEDAQIAQQIFDEVQDYLGENIEGQKI